MHSHIVIEWRSCNVFSKSFTGLYDPERIGWDINHSVRFHGKNASVTNFRASFEVKLWWFFPHFGKPPSGARIPMKLNSEISISKLRIENVTRILQSEIYFIKICSSQNAPWPVELPCMCVALFYDMILGNCYVPGVSRAAASPGGLRSCLT